MRPNTLNSLIPAPLRVTPAAGTLALAGALRLTFPPEAAAAAEKLQRLGTKLKLTMTENTDSRQAVVFRREMTEAEGAWSLQITPEKITISAGDPAGFAYGAGALFQMLVIALRRGPVGAVLDCGTVEDVPRFGWRGFMLDSARHFQSAATVKTMLRLLAEFRINVFHWHLADNQAWRLAIAAAPGVETHGDNDDGSYTPAEIREITALASELGILVVPEIDVPGHSGKLLSLHPELSCDPEHPKREFCLGNPRSLTFIKEIFAEVLKLFPDSPVIHLGGDEANTDNWEKCPKCRQDRERRGLQTCREQENAFMSELADFILQAGRTPMLWGTCSGQKYDPRVIMQAWLDMREPIRMAADGNKVVYSVHTSLYFDYPASLSEPNDNWMFELSERGIYLADPYVIWEDQVKEAILGTEACLWTEMVPEWRVLCKTLPRLPAYAECAWSAADRKEYSDFVRRRELLEAAGYFDLLVQEFRR